VELTLRHGPGRDLDAFVNAMQQLHNAMTYLEGVRNLLAAKQAYMHTEKAGGRRCAPHTAGWLLPEFIR
jgi:hypothetical protein